MVSLAESSTQWTELKDAKVRTVTEEDTGLKVLYEPTTSPTQIIEYAYDLCEFASLLNMLQSVKSIILSKLSDYLIR
jgi:hypothetical protein